ncbi:putative ubiquinone biosynthesis monooxygenase [Arthrobotrys musiformis]|uniref:Ubiquinone biosynthesis monooxygenase COQ6, mitochondrial n=1 Tax=Arthrobotrys musiformis TaxID=47236 RepID=A0AAV9WAZ1_9PEZI
MRRSLLHLPIKRSAWAVRTSNAARITATRSFASEASPNPEIYDIVVVGGGPVGLTLAASLGAARATSHLKVALIEGMNLASIRDWKPTPDYFANRIVSLIPSTVKLLKETGVWKHIKQERVQSYDGMQVWDGMTDARVEFDWNKLLGGREEGMDTTIAHMVENIHLSHGLLKRLDELAVKPTMIDKTKVEKIEYGQLTEEVDMRDWPIVSLSNGQKLGARLLIGADGGNSPVRTFAGIESRGWDYERHSMVATFKIEDDSAFPKFAYQRFLPSGPVAILPLPGNFANLAWSTTPEKVAHLKSLAPEDFVAMVNAAFRLSYTDIDYLHNLKSGVVEETKWRESVTKYPDPPTIPVRITEVLEGTRASFPLKMKHADRYIGERIALVGDAAHTIHPMAGQGLNAGVGDVYSLVKSIADGISHGQDIGSSFTLEPYQSERYLPNNALLGFVDKLHTLYGFESGPLVPLRSIGVEIINRDWFGLKKFLMSQAAKS